MRFMAKNGREKEKTPRMPYPNRRDFKTPGGDKVSHHHVELSKDWPNHEAKPLQPTDQ